MKIERIIIRDLRALRERDDQFLGPGGAPHTSICLRGLNGSGKTTYLEALAQLWHWFRLCTKKRAAAPGEPLLKESNLVAALFSGLPGPEPRLWIGHGFGLDIKKYDHGADTGAMFRNKCLEFWDRAFARAETGLTPHDTPPNVVWIEAENKYVPALSPDELTSIRPAPAFVPVARYDPNDRTTSHLEIVMRALFLARRDSWDILVKYIGELRPGLVLLDQFDEASQRPLFQLPSGAIIGVEHLSAGERSLLINLCMILRWLAPGGIVLLDEPELHQHVSLMRSSLAVIDRIIATEFNGQLIVASHAPEVWDHFRRTDAIIDLGDPAA
jgi:hypothetical protein